MKIKKFDELKKEKGHFRVAIFGSSQIKEGDVIYKQVKHLATLLGERDIDLVTGGGPGLMQAASEGHQEGKSENFDSQAHSIGVGIDLPWKQRFNDSVEYKKQLDRFSKRLDEFMLLSNVVVVAPGGLGTILELFYTWQLVQVHHVCNIPIILIGSTWKGLLEWVKKEPLKHGYLDHEDYDLVYHAKNEGEAMKIIDHAYEHFKKDGTDFCLNYKKYKIK